MSLTKFMLNMSEEDRNALWMETANLANEKANAADGTKDEQDAIYRLCAIDILLDLAEKRLLAQSTVAATATQESTNSSTE